MLLNSGGTSGPLVKALNELSPPILESNWSGESTSRFPAFVSPGSRGEAEQPKPQSPVRAKKQATVQYVQTFVGPRRRPNAQMPLDAHRKTGRLLKEVLALTYNRKGVFNKVNSVRSDLDEWVMREYSPQELDLPELNDIYYREENVSFPKTLSSEQRTKLLENLVQVKAILVSNYPDCTPLRELLAKLDSASKSLFSWGA